MEAEIPVERYRVRGLEGIKGSSERSSRFSILFDVTGTLSFLLRGLGIGLCSLKQRTLVL